MQRTLQRQRSFKLIRSAFVICLSGWVAGACTPSIVQAATNEPLSDARLPLVIMKQAQLTGRVFCIQEEASQAGKDSTALTRKGIAVQLREPDGNTLLHETTTAEDGYFALPGPAVGMYKLVVGRLTLNLKVEDPGKLPEGVTSMPKTVVVFIPEGLSEGTLKSTH